jgi:plastocyanin
MTMYEDRSRERGVVPSWLVLLIAVAALVVAATALAASLIGGSTFGMMSGGRGMMSGGGGMMSGGGPGVGNGPEPGTSGFVSGTVASPRVIRVVAGPDYAFSPSTITVARGETVTFLVTTMGPTVHEFMVGPADAVASDKAGTPEIADIAMMTTKSLTYTFDGPGPFAFACHADGHYEAGMRGRITIVG